MHDHLTRRQLLEVGAAAVGVGALASALPRKVAASPRPYPPPPMALKALHSRSLCPRVIEQVGSPTEIYREPASAFVADFVGKVNVLPGRIEGARLHVGQWSVGTGEVPSARDRNGAVKVYLRPEDIRARSGDVSRAALIQGHIEKIEFLGAFCHVHVQAPQLSSRPLVVYLSLNFLAEQGLSEGSDLPLSLMPERIKIF